MNLTEIAYEYRPVVFLVTVFAMVFGLFSYFSLPTREDPEVTIREAVISTRYPGLAADRIELLVTKTIEEAVREVSEIEEVRSVSMPGISIVHVEILDRYFELDQIWDEVRQKVDRAASQLPDGARPPQVNDDFGDVAVVTAALRAPDFGMGDMFDIAQHVRDRLYAMPGTKRVDVYGAQEERIYIETENARLAELGLSNELLLRTLRDQNIIRPGGEVDSGDRSLAIEPTGNFESVDDVEDTLIRSPQTGDLVPLRDFATVHRGIIDPPVQKVYFDGEPAIMLAVSMLDGYSVLDFGIRVKEEIEEVRGTLPVGYSLDIVTFQAEQVENAVYGVTSNVLQTLAIVLGVVILFLGIRTGLIVGAIVPSVMLATLAVMGFFEMPLERMSLATLVIALGLLVDNGIVIAEDFKRRLEDGLDRDRALKKTGGELAIPLLTSTLTTILVFLPLMLAENISGEYTRSISLVVLITLLASWVFAMTVTPSLCHRFIEVGSGNTRGDGNDSKSAPNDISQRLFGLMTKPYERMLRSTLEHRTLFLISMVALLGLSIVGLRFAPKRFFPDSDREQIMAYIDLPAGVSMRTTDESMKRVMNELSDKRRFPHVDSYVAYVGFGGPRFVLALTPVDPAPNTAVMLFNIDQYENISAAKKEVQALFDTKFPELDAQVTTMYLGPSDSTKIEIQVKGPDADYLFEKGREIERLLAGIPGAWGIQDDWQNRTKNVVVDVNQSRARRAGVTSADVARSMQGFFSGRMVTEFREGDDVFPIVARARERERRDFNRLETLSVQSTATGETVPLTQVADIHLESELGRIHREDLERTITIEARNRIMTAEDMVPRIQPALEKIESELAPGHRLEIDGVVEQSNEARSALLANVPLCIGVIVVLMVIQFNSYRRPAIIFATIPLLLVGAVAGIYVMNANFGFMVILGLYSLAGIVINNAIVLIDRIDIERSEGATDDFEAIISASVRRLRPILMTTVTTILGLLPLIVARDALFYGMANVIAFGLLVGTILTLGVVPVLYSLLFGIQPGTEKGETTP